MNQGDIVIADYPFSSLKQSKIRPAVIVSNERFNKGEDIILVPVTTVGDGQYRSKISTDALEEGYLTRESYIHYSNLFTMEKRLIMQKVAKLKPTLISDLIDNISKNFRA
ncbi:MAG: type II toxin-antitoxin system PemK/MazF family toxin [Candidatus Gracilibacteria bacterium]|nr:type II toxin-antitoxin system PemK/MazF family toxin [Candidatus Gracilibacteria bacterium]